MSIYIESLGCARNQVDSENMAGRLLAAGWTLTRDPAQATVIVVNTCSFVESAADESIDTILEMARFKREGVCNRLVVAGCLPERYREEIAEALPEVDQFLGTGAFSRIIEAVTGKLAGGPCLLPDPDSIAMDETGLRERELSHTAYLKIAEGCSRHCTYCIIPRLRGHQKSRPMEQIIKEAQQLIASGAKELNLVSQDTTHYGHDLPEEKGLETLLTRLAEIDRSVWIRFLYGHPESITDGVIETVADHDNICSYFDLPIQHVADGILKRMGRNYDKDRLIDLFDRIRSKVPGAVLRTTLIVGFPGETQEDFTELLDFVEQVRFDHLGVFVYSDAEDLPAHNLSGHISKKVAQSRHDRIMERQMAISSENLANMVGRSVPVLIEASLEPGLYEGRSMIQAPEVDGMVFVNTRPDGPVPKIGDIASVGITQTMEYDLIGYIV